MFTAFHRLEAAAARRVLADAAALVPWSMFFTAPWIRPFRLTRWLFTYVVPLAPLCNLWDGLVSSLRTYTAVEMLALATAAAPGYRWEAGALRGRGPTVTYLVGWPTPPSRASRQTCARPPSTASSAPVTYEAPGDARNTTAPATSSALPKRPRGVRARRSAAKPSSTSCGNPSLP